jgi:arsenite-transporting ATPase
VRVLLFAGKGGAGTTTVAAATAVAAARHGVKTLLLAPEQPQALADLLGTGTRPGVPQEVEPSLALLHADPAAQVARTWSTLQRYLRELPDATLVGPAEVRTLLAASGVRPMMALLALRDQVHGGPWDLVVVDGGTGPQTVRLLTLADDLLHVVDRVWSPERHLGLLRRRPHPIVSRAVARLRGELEEVRSVLRSPSTSARLVLVPERPALAQARRTMTALTAQGFAVDGVVVNRVMADDDGWPPALRSAQQAVLAAADSSFAPVSVQPVPYLGVEPAGDELSRLADPEHGAIGALLAADRLLAPVLVPHPRVRQVGEAFELVVALPFVSAAEVELTRDGDELHLAVADTRRAMALPSVLRRCVVRSASVADGRLVVLFERDPSVWPQRTDDDRVGAAQGRTS